MAKKPKVTVWGYRVRRISYQRVYVRAENQAEADRAILNKLDSGTVSGNPSDDAEVSVVGRVPQNDPEILRMVEAKRWST